MIYAQFISTFVFRSKIDHTHREHQNRKVSHFLHLKWACLLNELDTYQKKIGLITKQCAPLDAMTPFLFLSWRFFPLCILMSCHAGSLITINWMCRFGLFSQAKVGKNHTITISWNLAASGKKIPPKVDWGKKSSLPINRLA